MTGLLQDLRYGLRMLCKSPGFAFMVVLIMAVGIGANTTMFSVIHTVLLRPLPFPHSERMVYVWGDFPLGNQAAVSVPDFLDYRAQNHVFEHFSAFGVAEMLENLSDRGGAQQVTGTLVTTDFFETLVRVRSSAGHS